MAYNDKVQIEHKELGATSEVLEESLPVWTERGWTVVDDGGSDEPEESAVDPKDDTDSAVLGAPDDADEEYR